MTPIERAEKEIKYYGGVWEEEGWVVKGNLSLFYLSLSALPKIKSVGGWFHCVHNRLTNLAGSPKLVGGNFYCWDNPLKSLSGLPDKIGGEFDCDNLSFPKEEILLLIKAHPRNLKEIIKRIKWI